MSSSRRADAGRAPSVALARALIAEQFPHWSRLPVRAVRPGGWDNRTYRLGEALSIRMPSRASYAAQVEKEQRWLPRLAAQLPMPIPQPMALGAPGQDYLWPWSVYRWLPGEPTQRDRVRDVVAFARALGGFLTALRACDATGGPPPGAHNFWRGAPPSIYDAETRAALRAFSGRLDVIAAERIWEAALAAENAHSPVWVHGDVAVGNLLLEKGALCAVIDFGSSAVGDPACDTTMAWTFFTGEGRHAFLDALQLDAPTLARGRGWALWKALVTLRDFDGVDAAKVRWAEQTLSELLGE